MLKDFKGYKKVAEDTKTATFKHEKHGHELRVAKDALSPKMRDELSAIKLCGGGDVETKDDDVKPLQPKIKPMVGGVRGAKGGRVMLADGGVDIKSIVPQVAPVAPQAQQANDPTPQEALPGLGPTLPPTTETDEAPGNVRNLKDMDPNSPAEVDDTTPDEAPVKTDSTPEQALPLDNINDKPFDPIEHAANVKNELQQEDMAWQHDLANQHITPKTYQSMFNDQSTLGKIGTLFGLMVSGAGSGLAHQSNAVMDLMNKEIDRDLEAQKASKANAQNYIQLNNQQQLQQAQIGLMQHQGSNYDAQTKLAQIDAKTKGDALAHMQANRAVLQHLVNTVKNMSPNDPKYQQAQEQLALLANQVQNENYNIQDRAAAQSAAIHSSFNDQNPQGQSPIQHTAEGLRGQLRAGIIDKGQYDKANEELKLIENKQQANKGALDSFDKVSGLTTVGNRMGSPLQSYKQINAEWDPMLDKLTKSNEGRVTPITVDMMNAIKPAVGDSAETLKIKRQKLNEILNSGYSTPVLDGLRLSPGKQAEQPAATQKPTEQLQKAPVVQNGSDAGVSKSGRPMIWINGVKHYK